MTRTAQTMAAGLCAVGAIITTAAIAFSAPPLQWRVGQLVGLRAGTCIREGPGTAHRAHTRVPEDNWTVRVIDGPRMADGKTWYDTSRRAAGDPSGGTGWVDASQSDMCPESRLPTRDLWSWLERLQRWWSAQGATGKWIWALVVLTVLTYAWQRLSLTLWAVIRLAIVGLVLWWVVDQLRPNWQDGWSRIVGGDGPDLALLVALLPALSWVVRQVSRRRPARR